MTLPKDMHETADEMLREGTGPVQGEFLELTRRTRHSLHYCDAIVWGNLQTAEYARAVLRRVVDFHESPDDVEAGVAARTARAQFIGKDGRTFHLLLGEQALRSNLGGAEVMRGQLTRILDALGLTGLKLGVIPARAELDVYPGHSFSIYDGQRVEVETYSAGLTITDKSEVAVYEKAFTWLERSAVYGDEARGLVQAELNALG